MIGKRSIGSDSITALLYSVLSSGVGIVTAILVARWLGPVGKGLYSGLGLLQSGVAAATGGVGAAITYLMTKRGRTIGELFTPLTALLGLVSFLTWIGLLTWGARNGFSTTWLVFALCVPAAVIVSWQGYFFLGLGRVRTLNRLSFGRALLMVAALFLAVRMLHGGVTGAMVAWGAASYAAAVFVIIYAIRMGRGASTPSFWQDLKQLIWFGSRSSLDGTLGFFAYRLDSLLIIAYLGVSGYGIYSVASAGGEVLYIISRSVASASAHAIGSSNLSVSSEVTARAVRTTIAVIAIMAAILFLLAPPFVNLLFGAKFQAAILPFRIMLPGVVAYAPAGIFSAFFAYQLGRPLIYMYLGWVLLVIQATGCVLLVPRVGLAGAAIASTLTYFANAVLETWYFCKVTGLHPGAVWLIKREDIKRALRSLPRAARL